MDSPVEQAGGADGCPGPPPAMERASSPQRKARVGTEGRRGAEGAELRRAPALNARPQRRHRAPLGRCCGPGTTGQPGRGDARQQGRQAGPPPSQAPQPSAAPFRPGGGARGRAGAAQRCAAAHVPRPGLGRPAAADAAGCRALRLPDPGRARRRLVDLRPAARPLARRWRPEVSPVAAGKPCPARRAEALPASDRWHGGAQAE